MKFPYPTKLRNSVGKSSDHERVEKLLAEHSGDHLAKLRFLPDSGSCRRGLSSRLGSCGRLVSSCSCGSFHLGLVEHVKLLLALLDLLNLLRDVVVRTPEQQNIYFSIQAIENC